MGEIFVIVEQRQGEIREITYEMLEAWKRYAQETDVYDHTGRFDTLFRKAYGVH